MVEQAVRSYLVADSGVAALAGSRGYVQRFPQNPTGPAFRVQLIDEVGTTHLRGETRTKMARVQVDAIAGEASGVDPYAQASALADAIEVALLGVAPFVAGGLEVKVVERPTRMSLYDADELRQVRIVQDFLVWSRPSS